MDTAAQAEQILKAEDKVAEKTIVMKALEREEQLKMAKHVGYGMLGGAILTAAGFLGKAWLTKKSETTTTVM